MLWVVKTSNYGLGQVHTEYEIKLGSFTVLRWLKIYTPKADWN